NAAGPIWRQTMGQQDALSLVPAGQLLYAFDGAAKKDVDFPLTTGAAISTTPVFADLDGDHRGELAMISQEGILYVWKTSWEWDQQTAWPQHGGGLRRDFYRAGSTQMAPASADWLPAKKVFCYPNPVEDGKTNIRFTLEKMAELVTVHFYTLAGRSAGKLQAVELVAGDHELVWDVGSVQSGVYMARVEARFGGESKVQIIKIAVVK
ncbi:T9SS type A sorting domain-containing protein, partial [candidate division KSB1 bacterium]|nr:T9SS type A sorting domain-containing protein [candidate division KSB1 bacterium]